MKRCLPLLGALILALAAWRISTLRPVSPEPSIDVVMDLHAQDAVEEAKTQYATTLDYTPQSIKKVDAILGKLHAQHLKEPIDEKTLGRKSRLWGAYLGAAAKRVRSAQWQLDSQAVGEGSLPLVFSEKDQTFPCTWAYKRIVNGEEDNVAIKFQMLIQERGRPLKILEKIELQSHGDTEKKR